MAGMWKLDKHLGESLCNIHLPLPCRLSFKILDPTWRCGGGEQGGSWGWRGGGEDKGCSPRRNPTYS